MDQYRAMALAISNCNLKLKSAAVATCRSTAVASPSILPAQALRLGRRALLGVFLSTSAALPAAAADDSRSLLLQKYLKKSQENKTKNDKERLESYYKRNYKDYFESFEGSLKGKDQLSDTEKEILDWLQKNK